VGLRVFGKISQGRCIQHVPRHLIALLYVGFLVLFCMQPINSGDGGGDAVIPDEILSVHYGGTGQSILSRQYQAVA
jgi:hypothetical protein